MVNIKMKKEYVLTFEDKEKYNEQKDALKELLDKYNISYTEFKYVKGFAISLDELAEKPERLFHELSQLEGLLIEETNEFTAKDTDDSVKDKPYQTDVISDDKEY
ncbi:MAG: hypothetical protein PWR30_380 [Candidatus Woesearchaeota archaeon]|nr:hypothetical protein [Candidatus Woesearchaeota archaeon]